MQVRSGENGSRGAIQDECLDWRLMRLVRSWHLNKSMSSSGFGGVIQVQAHKMVHQCGDLSSPNI